MGKNQLGKDTGKLPSKGCPRTFLAEDNPQPKSIDVINPEGHPANGSPAGKRGTEPVKGKMGS